MVHPLGTTEPFFFDFVKQYGLKCVSKSLVRFDEMKSSKFNDCATTTPRRIVLMLAMRISRSSSSAAGLRSHRDAATRRATRARRR